MSNENSNYDLKHLIDSSMARKPASLIIKNANWVSVTTGEIIKNIDVIIKDKYIVGVGTAESDHFDDNTETIDASGLYLAPGLIDGHIHVESSMSSPTFFAETVIPRGTTTVVSDPHEIGNVLGVKGVKLMLDEGENLPLKFLFEVPSCVPSLPGFETTGEVIGVDGVKELVDDPRIFGLAEVMNYPGVFLADDAVLAKIKYSLEKGKIVEGHAPSLTGKQLDAYLTGQIRSDHECETPEEAIEKLRKGMHIQIREGSFAKNMKKLLTALMEQNIDLSRCSVVSDDRHPDDLYENGHLDHSLRIMVNDLNMDPIEAIKLVTLNPATAIHQDDRIGIIAPGKLANIVIFGDLVDFNVRYTIYEGKVVAKAGELVESFPSFTYPEWAVNTTENIEIPTIEELKVKTERKEKTSVRVIKVMEHSLVTEKTETDLLIKHGYIEPDLTRDILPMVVIDRHNKTGNIGKGFVTGLGLKSGAIATTVAHDTHQLIVVGTDYKLMIKAIERIKEIKGGYVVVNYEDEAVLPLEFGGIMSTFPIKKVVANIKEVRKQLEQVGTDISEPMMALSFLALPVIPKLKLTDKGLFDVEKFEHVKIEV